MLSRRRLLENAVKISAGLACAPAAISLADESALITLRLAHGTPVDVPANFIGLGYEMSSVASTGLLDPENHRYIELIRGLGPKGVLRVGGIVANYTRYEPQGTVLAERQNTVITRAVLERFAAFLRITGWTAIWSLNFAQGTIQQAAEEARAVADALGPQLLALEVGNEVDNYGGLRQTFRKAPYGYETYRREYAAWHAAILKSAPGVRFAAPDTAQTGKWVERMAKDANGDVQLLTTHYYRNNQRRGSAEQLLLPDPRLKEALTQLRAASQQSGIPWRMCETNSFSGGGRPGVSDTFIGALWTLDTMLLLAQYGCAGVNIETGVNQLGFVSSYSPIRDNGRGVNTAGVPYYGMLAFATAVSGAHQVLPAEIERRGVNVTAYVLGVHGTPRCIVVVNKDNKQDAHISMAEAGIKDVSALRLLAPSADSKSGVTFGGAAVDAQGRWKAKTAERIRSRSAMVPRMSAAVLRAVDQR